DTYVMKVPGMSGMLQPIRFDNPSAVAQFGNNKYYGSNIALSKLRLVEPSTSKVQFMLYGERSNYYSKHKDLARADDGGFNPPKGLFAEYARRFVDPNFPSTTLAAPYIREQPRLETIESDRKGFESGKLFTGSHVAWWSNKEIREGIAALQGFMHHDDYSKRLNNHQYTHSTNSYPENGIGGFMITDINGFTYHFSIPVYVLENERIYSIGIDYYESNQLLDPYAYKWLLTGITGPDFMDNGSTPYQIDDKDNGYFVKFKYGKYSDRFIRSGGTVNTPENEDASTRTKIVRQEYFLNEISTKTHTALFLKSSREDLVSKGHVELNNEAGKKLLKLDEVIVLRNADLKNLALSYGNSNNYSDNVLLGNDISHVADAFKNKTLASVSFGQDYSLNQPFVSRLTLKSTQSYGFKKVKAIPPYLFNYSFNPSSGTFDAWGMHQKKNTVDIESYKRTSSSEATAWSLDEIITPRGDRVRISYESDDYSSVMGEAIEESVTERYGGGIRVAEISQRDIYQGTTLTTQYRYTQNGEVDGNSSGVITNEPPFILGEDRVNDDLFGFSDNQLVYNRVDRIQLSSDNNQLSRTTMRFRTPNTSMIKIDTLLSRDVWVQPEVISGNHKYGYRQKEKVYDIQYHDMSIGLPIETLQFDKNDILVGKTEYSFREASYGKITQGLHLYDFTYQNYLENRSDVESLNKNLRARYINTVISKIPYELTNMKFYDVAKNRHQETVFTNHNFYSGLAMTTIANDGYGNKIATVNRPVFETSVLSQMGLKHKGGKNQLSSIAEEFVYRVKNTSDDLTVHQPEFDGILHGSVQTFSRFGESWLPYRNYVLNRNSVDGDGLVPLLSDLEKFDYQQEHQNGIWLKTNEVLKYGNFSNMMERQTTNGRFESIRYDGDQSRIIATATNARLSDFVFSSAELPLNGSSFTNGLSIGGGVRSTIAHSGDFSLEIPSGQSGYAFEIPIDEKNNHKTFEVICWVYHQSSPSFQLEYTIDGASFSEVVNLNTTDHVLVNGWYQYRYLIPVSVGSLASGSKLSVSISNADNTSIYVDDFKVGPVDSEVSCLVYDEMGNPAYTFSSNHFYVRTTYDAFGRVAKIHEETRDGVFLREHIHYNFGQN
ncbi:MAG: hypothetical protein AAGA66_18360, partial [Bacteroidota bacterium]